VTLAVADVSGAVASTDSRLTDARQPTLHASTHHTGGTDALAPNNISAAWAQVVSGEFISSNTLLSSGRNRRITLSVVATANVDLPYENNVNGDVVTLVKGATGGSTATIRKADALSGGSPIAYSTLATLATVGQSFTFVSDGTATGWSLRAVDTHTHTGAQVNVGTTANLPLKTGTNGVVEAGAFGTAAGSFCAGDDARLAAIPPASTATPSALGTAAAGTATEFARADHVHAMPTAADVGAVSSQQLPLDSGMSPPYGDGQVLAYDGTGGAFIPISLNIPDVGTPSVAASYSGPVDSEGFATVTITANTAGAAGNNITLTFDGVDDVDTVLAAWNAANPSNQATLVSGDGELVGEDGYIISLSGGATNAAASGSITTSGLTQATARILGRTTASTGAVEEIQIGSGLSLSAGELSATGGSGGGEVRGDFVSPYTYTGLADAGTSESTASWTIRRSEFDAGGSFVATLTASAVEWDDRLTASYA
jgi:hypothetical protein